MNTRVEKEGLIRIINENRAEHEAIFNEAVEGYRVQATKILEDQIQRIKSGDLTEVSVRLPRPVNHLRDYDRVTRMLMMEIEDEVIVDEQSFAAYVMDDWDWKRQFLASNSAYSGTAMAQMNTI